MSKGAKKAGAPFSAEELRAVAEAVRRTPKPQPAETVLRLLPVGPWRLHAFWSVSPEDWVAGEAGMDPAEAVPVLRLFDFTPLSPASRRPHPPFDVRVAGPAGRCYVDLWKDGKTYVAELGLQAGERFVCLARSHAVELPAAGPSPVADVEWRRIRMPAEGPAGPTVAPDRAVDPLFRPVFPKREPVPEFPVARLAVLAAAVPPPAPGDDRDFPLPECPGDVAALAFLMEAEALAAVGGETEDDPLEAVGQVFFADKAAGAPSSAALTAGRQAVSSHLLAGDGR